MLLPSEPLWPAIDFGPQSLQWSRHASVRPRGAAVALDPSRGVRRLAGVGRRKGTREQPPIWVLALILVGCACLVVVTEVLGHWFSRSQWRSFLPHDVEL